MRGLSQPFLVRLVLAIKYLFKAIFKPDKEKKLHLYGIYGFLGLPGQGKTMALTYVLNEYRKKYGDDIYICTNYFFEGQDFAFEHWEQLLQQYDKPLVVAWDEVQNEFNSRNFKNFPTALLTLLTQNRKGNGIQILYTAQRFDRVDKVFRELTNYFFDCRTIFKRFTKCKAYDDETYLMLHQEVDINKKMKIHKSFSIKFVQTDELRNMYDSYKMLDSAKSKDYMSREELYIFNQ